MTNIFTEGLNQLAQTLSADVEIPITYKHKGHSYNIKAVRGGINWGTLNRLGDATLHENHRDYILRSEQLSFEPSNRDLIIDGSETFEVFNEDTSSACWRYSDSYKTLMRIYTRRIA